MISLCSLCSLCSLFCGTLYVWLCLIKPFKTLFFFFCIAQAIIHNNWQAALFALIFILPFFFGSCVKNICELEFFFIFFFFFFLTQITKTKKLKHIILFTFFFFNSKLQNLGFFFFVQKLVYFFGFIFLLSNFSRNPCCNNYFDITERTRK